MKKTKRVVSFGSALAVVMALFTLAGCGDAAGGPTGGPPGGLSLDKTALGTSISQAETALNETGKSDTSGANVAVGTPWVTTTVWNAFQGKIGAAKGVFNSPGSQSQIDTAAENMDDERDEFVTNRNPSGAGPALNKGALDAKIATANTAKSGVEVSPKGDGSDVSSCLIWVSQSEWDAFTGAIDAAVTARNSATDQSAIDTATGALNTALTTFNNAKTANGNGGQGSGFSAAQLAALVNEAKAAKTGVMVASSADDVPPGKTFVSQTELDTFTAAITTAEAGGDIDNRYTALAAALTAFNAAKATGTAPNKATLESNIAAAGSAMTPKPFIAASAGEAPLGKAWVTQGEWNAIETAYTAALSAMGPNATKNEVDAAASALDQATAAFTSAKNGNGLGTKPASVTITGIPAGTTQIAAALFANQAAGEAFLHGEGEPLASGTVSSPGTSAAIPLLDADDDPWGGSGSAVIALLVTNGSYESKLYGYANGTTAVSYNFGLHPWVSLGFSAFKNVGWPTDFGEMDLDGWTGTLDQLCQSEMGRTYAQMLATVPNPDDHRFYSDIWLTQAVTGAEVINASTVLYSRLPFFVGGGPEPEPEPEPPVGSISGTITLTGIPATNKPTVTISALSPGSSIEDFFRPYGRDLVLSGSGTQTISWTIPLSQDDADKFGASPRTVEFMLYVAPEGMMDKGFYITLCTHTVNAATDDTVLGNIGTASVAYVILSGTLNISYNGQAVPQMFISAKASEGHYVGSAYIAGNSATSGIPWSMVIWPSFASPTTVSFEISHASVVDPDPFFNVPGLSPTTVYKTDVSGIHLNVGNITGD